MKKLKLFLLIVIASLSVSGREERNYLQQIYKYPGFDSWLLPGNNWILFPKYCDRAAWEKLPVSLREKYIRAGEKFLDFNWPALKASDCLDYNRKGDDSMYRNTLNQRQSALESLVMAELMEGEGRFTDQIINGVWLFCEQTFWGPPAALFLQKSGAKLPDVSDPTIELVTGNQGTTLAWTYYFFKSAFDQIDPLISKKLEKAIKEKILEPYYTRDNFFWQGFNLNFVNNWSPWCNYNILNCILLVENDPVKKLYGIRKVMRSLDQFINYYHDDGGCDEGPGYWENAGGKLFESLELLYRLSGGRISIFDKPLIRDMGNYICKVNIHDSYFVNFADATPENHPDPWLIYHYGKRTGDESMMEFGSYLVQADHRGEILFKGKIESVLNHLLGCDEIFNYKKSAPLFKEFWLPGTEIAGGRDKAGGTTGFYFAAKGGSNNESHNHNDVGSFILYFDGDPILVDPGIGKYTKKTFSKDRYQIWTMQSQYHNLPRINGHDQLNGWDYIPQLNMHCKTDYRAKNSTFSSNGSKVRFSTDISGAYPKEAGIINWVRSYELERGRKFMIYDNYRLGENSDSTSLNFISPCRVNILRPGFMQFIRQKTKLMMKYNPNQFKINIEEIAIDDTMLQKVWRSGLRRIVMEYKTPGKLGQSKIEILK